MSFSIETDASVESKTDALALARKLFRDEAVVQIWQIDTDRIECPEPGLQISYVPGLSHIKGTAIFQ